MFLLRKASEEDELALLALIKAAFEEQRGRVDPPSSALRKTRAILRRELQTASALVAQLQPGRALAGELALIGCVFYEPQGDVLYLSRLAVMPTYRGRGVGVALMREAEIRGKRMGLRAATLSVRLSLQEQQNYYEKLGYHFVAYGVHEGYTEPTFLKMEKKL